MTRNVNFFCSCTAVERFRCVPDCGLCCRASPVTVLPHEVYILTSLARRIGVDVTFEPSYTVADAVRRIRIALSYLMHLNEGGMCPFYDPRTYRCSVHGPYKPLTCRSFPYLPRVIKYRLDRSNKTLDFEVRFVMSSLCPIVRKDLPSLGDAARIGLAAKYAPQETEAALETVIARRLYAELLSDLWRRGIVELDDGSKYPMYPRVNGFSLVRQYYRYITVGELIGMARKMSEEYLEKDLTGLRGSTQ